MNKRPMCLLCLGLMAVIWLMEFLGMTYGGNPQDQKELERWVDGGCSAAAVGRISRWERKQDCNYLYLNHANLVISTEKIPNQKNANQISLETIRVRWENKRLPNLRLGNLVCVRGNLYEASKASNPGQFDVGFYYRMMGIQALMEGGRIQILDQTCSPLRDWMSRWREKMKKQLVRIAPQEAGILSAMLLGDKSLLEEVSRKLYQISGIVHILAISGTHLTVIGMGLMKMLQKLGVPRIGAGLFAAVVMILYGIFTGGSVSAVRAVVMFVLSVAALPLGRTYDLLSALSLAGILILVQHPGYLYHSGFLLSFGAVAGVGILLPVIGSEKQTVLNGFYTALAVLLVQLPILTWYFFEISLFSLAANLLVLPLLPVVLVSGILGLLGSFFNLQAGMLLLWPARGVLSVYEAVAWGGSCLPGASLITGQPRLWQAAVYYGLLGVGIWLAGKKKSRWPMAVVSWIAVFALFWRPTPQFSLTMLDVGQGDCLQLSTETSHHYLIDGGSSSVFEVGENRILPCLKQRGVRRLEGIFISHGDDDHINGILEMLKGLANHTNSLAVKQLFLPHWMGKEKEQQLRQTARAAGVKVVYLGAGDRILDGEMQMDVLHPGKKVQPEDENSGSMTLKVSYGGIRMLLTGDLCKEGEERVASWDIACEVLKVAHHGSDSSTSEAFLEKTTPLLGLISCGANNRYGHPGPELLERLEKQGVQVFDTRKSGAVTVTVKKGGILQVEEFLKSG